MKRARMLKRPVGQLAYDYYTKWFKYQGKAQPNVLTFKQSSLFNPFIKFTEFVSRSNLPQPDKFIKFMIAKDYPPSMWLMKEVYPNYLEHLDNTSDPMDLVKESVDTLFNVADDNNVDVKDVFNYLTPAELLSYVLGRRVSPWLLLHSKKFKEYIQKMSPLDRTYFNATIRINFWSKKVAEQPEFTKKIGKIITALDL